MYLFTANFRRKYSWIVSAVADTLSRKHAWYFAVCKIMLIGLFFVHPVYAQNDTPTIKIYPVIIPLFLSPGKVQTQTITIENPSNIPLPLQANLSDFETTDEDGSYTFTDKTNPLLSWMKVEPNQLLVNPHEKKEVTVKITPPRQIPLGGYAGMLFFEPLVRSHTSGTTILPRIGILLLANIGGIDTNQHPLKIETLSLPFITNSGSIPFLLRTKNTSFHILTVKPLITIHSVIGNQTKKIVLEDKIIFQGKIRRWNTLLDTQLSPNIYNITIAVSAGGGNMVTTEKYMIIFPYTIVLILLIISIVSILLYRYRKRIQKAIVIVVKG